MVFNGYAKKQVFETGHLLYGIDVARYYEQENKVQETKKQG